MRVHSAEGNEATSGRNSFDPDAGRERRASRTCIRASFREASDTISQFGTGQWLAMIASPNG